MENRKEPPRSFNTVKKSNREEWLRRRRQGRAVLLASFAVAALILLLALILAIASIVGAFARTEEPAPRYAAIRYVQSSASSSQAGAGSLIVVSEKSGQIYTYPKITMQSMSELVQESMTQFNGSRPYTCTVNGDETMERTAARAAHAMLVDFCRSCNDSSLILIDAYRSKVKQADYKTPVGYSEHETGYVFTLECYNSVGARKKLDTNENYGWIYDNCAKYGIVCRYPSEKSEITGVSDYDECFRYVGVPHATYMNRYDLCLEEYIDLLRTQYAGDRHLAVSGADGKNYEVYYVKAWDDEITTVSVPENYRYTLSGDNGGGFIVTVSLDESV